ncbi:MAG: ABC transporter permease [Anaerolineae bacterium]|nr:ABC transporter permease [Anaerolineae bacterium]
MIGAGPAHTLRLLEQFIAVEWLKLRRSRTFKAILITMAATPAVALLALSWLEGNPIVFLRALEAIGAFLVVLGTFSALLLTATVLGSEFEQGTVQVIVERGIPRWMFIAGKGSALIVAAALSALAGWFCSGIAAVISHVSQAGTRILLLGILGLFTSGLDTILIVVLMVAAYVSLTMIVGVLTRSTAFTMFGGLGLFMADLLVNGDLGFEFNLGQFSTFSIFHNAVALLNKLQFTMAPLSLIAGGKFETQPAAAAAILLAYALGGFAVAIFVFQRQDL